MEDKNIYIVQREIALVVESIKKNSKQGIQTPLEEEPLLNGFIQLSRFLNTIKVLSEVEFLQPFLAVVRSKNVSGPITVVALSSLLNFLSSGLIDATHYKVPVTMESMADAITETYYVAHRSVAMHPVKGNMVLFKILEVFQNVLHSPMGAHLTDETVCERLLMTFLKCIFL